MGKRRCECAAGFGGDDCGRVVETPHCPVYCSGHGSCGDMGCSCVHSQLSTIWGGAGCATIRQPEGCTHGCSGKGTCVEHLGLTGKGKCVCATGFGGAACELVDRCPYRCSGRGNCILGVCACSEGWKGDECTVPACPADCSHHGKCMAPSNPGAVAVCICAGGWSGLACDVWRPHCPNRCSGHGKCVDGRCECAPGFRGDDCGLAVDSAPVTSERLVASPSSCGGLMCNGHGRCRRGRAEGTVLCECFHGYGGPTCAVEDPGPVVSPQARRAAA